MLTDIMLQGYPGIRYGREWDYIQRNVPVGILRKFIAKAKETLTRDEFESIVFVQCECLYGSMMPVTWVFKVRSVDDWWYGDEVFRFEN